MILFEMPVLFTLAIVFYIYGIYLFLFTPLKELIRWTADTHKIIASEGFNTNPDRVFKRDKLAGAMLQCLAWCAVSCCVLLALFIFGADWRVKTAVASAALFFFFRAFVFCAREHKLQKEGLEEALAKYYQQHPQKE